MQSDCEWSGKHDRHIAQRNIAVINVSQPPSFMTNSMSSKDSHSDTAVLQIPLRLQCSAPQGQAILEVITEKVGNVGWVMLLEGRHEVSLEDAGVDPNEIAGL